MKDKKNKKIVIIIMIVIGAILIGVLAYWLFAKQNEKVIDYIEYKSKIDGKVVQIYTGNVIEIRNERKKLHNILKYNNLLLYQYDNYWYLVDNEKYNLIAYNEENNRRIDYDVVYSDKEKCYVVYEEEKTKQDFLVKKIITIINLDKGVILPYDKNNPFYINQFENVNQILIKKNNQHYLLDIFNNLNETPVNNIASYSNEEYLVEIYEVNKKYYVNFNYYIDEIDEYKIYKNNNKELLIYRIDDEYFGYTDEYEIGYFSMCGIDNNDNKYITYHIDCHYGDMITVNKQTEEMYFLLMYKKTSNGYYLYQYLGDTVAPFHVKQAIYTENNQYLGILINYIEKDDLMYISNNGYVYAYNIKNNNYYKVSSKYDYIDCGIIANGTLYYIIKENNIWYLCNLNNQDKIKIMENKNVNSNYDEAYYFYVSYNNNNYLIIEENNSYPSFRYTYDLTTKELKKDESVMENETS